MKYSRVLFLGKKDDERCKQAFDYCKQKFFRVDAYWGEFGAPYPNWDHWKGDYILSYLSRWIVPDHVLKKAQIAAINFHPASPDYPGIGCYNFALYEGAKHYGVTCHHMAPKVDTGPIIQVKTFPLDPEENLSNLIEKTYQELLLLFYEVMSDMEKDPFLSPNGVQWQRKPFTRKDLNHLKQIQSDFSKEEVEKRIRATTYKGYAPFVELHGLKFFYKKEEV